MPPPRKTVFCELRLRSTHDFASSYATAKGQARSPLDQPNRLWILAAVQSAVARWGIGRGHRSNRLVYPRVAHRGTSPGCHAGEGGVNSLFRLVKKSGSLKFRHEPVFRARLGAFMNLLYSVYVHARRFLLAGFGLGDSRVPCPAVPESSDAGGQSESPRETNRRGAKSSQWDSRGPNV